MDSLGNADCSLLLRAVLWEVIEPLEYGITIDKKPE